jgi:hypothetical protein
MKSRVSHEPENLKNEWRNIQYLGGESGRFNVTINGKFVAQTDSLSAAKRERDRILYGPPEPAPAPISPQSFGYFDYERSAR